MKKYILSLMFVCCWCFSFSQMKEMVVVGSPDNDIVRILKENQIPFHLYNDVEKAIIHSSRGGTLLIFARNYPHTRMSLSARSFRDIKNKNSRVYIEFPDNIPGLSMDSPAESITLERGVINTTKIRGLDSLDLLGVNDHKFIPVIAKDSFVVLVKVAGYDKADYGLDDVEVCPLLFKYNNYLISTTKLSDVITSRFGPEKSWAKIWEFIFSEINPEQKITLTKWVSDLYPTYSREEKLPLGAFEQSIRKGTEWFFNARLFIHPTWQDTFVSRTSENGIDVVYPAISKHAPIGDGSLGILEGRSSFINSDGTQPVRWWLRADCQAEVAFAMTSSASILSKNEYNETAKKLLNNLYKSSNLRAGERNDPK